MSKSIKVFQNKEFGTVRNLIINDEPYFVGKDVAEIFGYRETAKAIRTHVDEEDKGVSVLDTPGGRQQITLINESGLYCLILSSNLPVAKKFKRWITSEVLPEIHRKGSYSQVKTENILKDPRLTASAKAIFMYLCSR
ncbi:MAG: Bro-N domain-containing protein, partial [Oscillospiraceae bacterium]